MFEKIRDFFFDIRDIIIVIAIISILTFSVTWKIGDTMDLDIESQVVIGGPEEQTTTPAVTTAPPTTMPTTEPTTTTTTTTKPEIVVFHVREGEYGQDIAQNLLSEGLIGSVDEFLVKAHEMGVDTSLRTGVYELKRTDDLETIIRLLSGGSRE